MELTNSSRGIVHPLKILWIQQIRVIIVLSKHIVGLGGSHILLSSREVVFLEVRLVQVSGDCIKRLSVSGVLMTFILGRLHVTEVILDDLNVRMAIISAYKAAKVGWLVDLGVISSLDVMM